MLRVLLLLASSIVVLAAAGFPGIQTQMPQSAVKSGAFKQQNEFSKGQLPISKNKTEVTIPLKNWSILSFPFEIKEVKKATNSGSSQTGMQDVDFASLNEQGSQQQPKQQQSIPQDGTVVFDVGLNTISIFPKEAADIKLTVWRSNGFPIMLDLKTTEDTKAASYFEFVDGYGADKSEAQAFEGSSHVGVIAELIKGLYNHVPPKGYKVEQDAFKQEMSGIAIDGVFTLLGDRYLAQEVRLTNKTKNEITLYEEMFYEPGIFSVSFENDTLKPGESTRTFFIRSLNATGAK